MSDVHRPEPLTEAELAALQSQLSGICDCGDDRPWPPMFRSHCEGCASHLVLGDSTTVVARLIADLRAERKENERLREALDFYANPEHWEAKFVGMAGSTEPNPGASVWESGPGNDGGERARRALNVPLP